MAEFITDEDGTQVARAPVYDDPDREPPADDALAPKGWVWNRAARQWKPRLRAAATPQQQEPQQQRSNRPPVTASEPIGAAAEGRDPEPSWAQDATPERPRHKQSIEDVPKETVDDMAGLAGLVGIPVLDLLQRADPYCGSILAQNYEPIVDAVLPLLCRSKKITDYFTGDKSDWLLWGKLAIALAPVGRAFMEHHVFHSVHVVRDEKTGAVQVVRGQPATGQGDHLVPPAPPFEYAA